MNFFHKLIERKKKKTKKSLENMSFFYKRISRKEAKTTLFVSSQIFFLTHPIVTSLIPIQSFLIMNYSQTILNFDLITCKNIRYTCSDPLPFQFQPSKQNRDLSLLLYSQKLDSDSSRTLFFQQHGLFGLSYGSSIPKIQQGTPSSRRVCVSPL